MAQVTVSTNDGIALVRLTNPPHGFMNNDTVSELFEHVTRLNDDDDVRVVAFTGGMDGIFIRHFDTHLLGEMSDGLRARNLTFSDQRLLPIREIDHLFEAMETSPKPMIAAINGTCMGGGLEFSLACDFRYAAAGDYTIGPIESRLGILPGAGGTVKLARLIGQAQALDLCLKGRAISPAEAHKIGVVHDVVDGDVVDHARAQAQQMAALPAKALGHIKRLIRQSAGPIPAELLALERTLFLDLLVTDEARDLLAQYNSGTLDITSSRD